jgi:hypothetical protein
MNPVSAPVPLLMGMGGIRVKENGKKVIINNPNQPTDSNNSIAHDAVIYDPGYITISRKVTDFGISFKFSGCLMAQLTIGVQRYIAHISTCSPGQGYDCKNEFIKFLDNINQQNIPISNLVLFKPVSDPSDYSGLPNDGTLGAPSAWGVIDRDNKCYSLSVAEYTQGNFRLFAIKRITKSFSTILNDLKWIDIIGWSTYFSRQKVEMLWKYGEKGNITPEHSFGRSEMSRALVDAFNPWVGI